MGYGGLGTMNCSMGEGGGWGCSLSESLRPLLLEGEDRREPVDSEKVE